MSARASLYIVIGTIALVAVLVPLMLVFDGARPLIAFGSMAVGAALLLWRAADQRPKR